ncbi:uncharacterized protein LOC103101628 [Monodelphis domestica]|uniref:uncharacterized protein LOC103101628 n=1 Tax=Monodelphis domestica TaxID=13616 RepID=UPI0024E1A83E|nr:uncharacterized protein LOC103101628 [Monodelphis domestica]
MVSPGELSLTQEMPQSLEATAAELVMVELLACREILNPEILFSCEGQPEMGFFFCQVETLSALQGQMHPSEILSPETVFSCEDQPEMSCFYQVEMLSDLQGQTILSEILNPEILFSCEDQPEMGFFFCQVETLSALQGQVHPSGETPFQLLQQNNALNPDHTRYFPGTTATDHDMMQDSGNKEPDSSQMVLHPLHQRYVSSPGYIRPPPKARRRLAYDP